MNIVSTASKGAAWLFAESWASALLGLMSSVILAHLLGPEAFGVVALAGLPLSIAGLFIGRALTECLQQKEEISPDLIDTVFWLNTGLAAVFGGLLVAVSGWIGALFDSETVAQIIPLMVFVAFVSSLSGVPSALLERRLAYDQIVKISAVAGLPTMLVTIGLAWTGWGAWSLVLGSLIGSSIGVAGSFYYAKWRPTFQFSFAAFQQVWSFNRDTIVLRFLDVVDSSLPGLLLGLFFGERAVGLLGLAEKISAQLGDLLMGPFDEMAMSVTARLQSQKSTIRVLLDQIYAITTSLVYPAAIGLCAIAPLLVPLVYGSAWTDAVIATQFLLLIALRSATANFNISILRGVGETQAPLIIVSIGIALSLGLAPVLLPYGVGGVAALIALRTFLTWPIAAKYVERAIGYPAKRQFTIGWEALLCAVLMGGVVHIGMMSVPSTWPPLLSIGLLIVLGVGVYGGLALLLARSRIGVFIQAAKALNQRDLALE